MQTSEQERVWEYVHLNDLAAVANELLIASQGIKIWLFVGEMGAGKTTLIKELCRQLNVTDVMGSPTFSIVNEYWTIDKNRVFHFDFYRIKSEQEAIDIGVEDYFYSTDYCFVEWPERIPGLLTDQYVLVRIQNSDSDSRKIYFKSHA